MNSIFKYILFLVAALSLTACEDFLQREPEDFTDENAFLQTEYDMQRYVNKMYNMFPKMTPNAWGHYMEDNNSDDQCGRSDNTLFYEGNKYTPNLNQSEWKFDNIRALNYFFQRMIPAVSSGSVVGLPENIRHYMGEAYFFKAYDYFRLLSTYGDVPIIDVVPSDDLEELKKASQRRPRNEVARYIIALCDSAASNLLEKAPATGRVSRDAALLFKARVALYEGTWEKYHAGTCFVPGNDKWVGAAMYPNFEFPAGSAEAEVNYFLEQAIAAADSVASKRQLAPNYGALFRDISGKDVAHEECILTRYYDATINGHAASHYLFRTGAGTGFTRSLVESFLTNNGLPIYADPTYKGDAVMYDMFQNRDVRLTGSVKVGGLVVDPITNDTLVNYKPQIWSSGSQGTSTGYEIAKWMSYDESQDDNINAGTTATPIFRSAEAYLIYLEANFERHGNIGTKGDVYWKALRQRAGVDTDYAKTIAATDLSKENDLATKSRSVDVDPTLYNIRRERRNEFISEGHRLLDLKRWRALDHMVAYQVEGMNLWDDIERLYEDKQKIVGEIVSGPGQSKYLRPFGVVATHIVYNGYNFPKVHYLEPIPVTEIILCTPAGESESTIYQNPGWPARIAGVADYSHNCD